MVSPAGTPPASGSDADRRETPRPVLVRAAVYEGGLAAGVGLRILDLERLRGAADDPATRQLLRAQLVQWVSEALAGAGVIQGEDAQAIDEAVDALLARAAEGSEEPVARKVAAGEAPVPGQDARLEYPLNPDNRPMREIEEVPPTARRRWVHMVHRGDVLVRRVPPVPGRPGRTVRGEKLEPPQAAVDVPLEALLGAHTVLEPGRILADCDGACEEDAAGRVRVVEEVEVEAVDERSGSLPEAGVSQAAILVRQRIAAGLRVASYEAVFVGSPGVAGRIEEGALVTAGHLVVNGNVLGQHPEAMPERDVGPIDVQGLCLVRQVSGAALTGARVLVAENSRFAWLDGDESVRIDGDLQGGVTVWRREVTVAGDVGTATGGSRTRLVVPREAGSSRRGRRLAAALQAQRKALSELQQKVEALEGGVARRAQSSPFWAALLSGESRQPRTPVEARALRLFADFDNERKRLRRSVDEVRLALSSLQQEGQEHAEAQEAGSLTLRIGGRLFLDVTLETAGAVAADELERQVTYTVDGKRFRNHALGDLRTVLARQMGEYVQRRSEDVAEHQQVLAEMFEGAPQRPTGPQMAHRRFALPFVWSSERDEDPAGQLQMATTAVMDTQDTQRLLVRTEVTAHSVLERVELSLHREGARVRVGLAPLSGTVRWQADTQLAEELAAVVFGGITAMAFLQASGEKTV